MGPGNIPVGHVHARQRTDLRENRVNGIERGRPRIGSAKSFGKLAQHTIQADVRENAVVIASFTAARATMPEAVGGASALDVKLPQSTKVKKVASGTAARPEPICEAPTCS